MYEYRDWLACPEMVVLKWLISLVIVLVLHSCFRNHHSDVHNKYCSVIQESAHKFHSS